MVATVEQLAELVRGRLVGDGSVSIQSARPVAEAGPGDITFIENDRFAKLLRSSPASAAIVGPHFSAGRNEVGQSLAVIEVDDPMSAFLAVRTHLIGEQTKQWTGIHPQAYVAPTAQLGKDVTLGGRLLSGERSMVSYVTGPELRNAVARGSLRGTPRALESLEVLSQRPSINAIINFRGNLIKLRGRFGDGIIGAQALEFGIPLVTNDAELAAAVRAAGGIVR